MSPTRPQTLRASAPVGQRGLAFVMVLWVAVLLALIASSVTRLSRTDVNLARNLAERTRAELAADSALWTAMYMVVNGGSEAWRMDGTIYAWRFGDAEVRVRVTDEHGRIDINAARWELLAALFVAAGAEQGEATALAESVAEYRTRGLDETAERNARTPSAQFAPPFAVIDQLEQVPGMSPALFDAIAPVITVYTGEPWPAPESASPLVLAATEGRVLEAPDADAGQEEGATGATETDNLEESPAVLQEPSEAVEISSDLLHIDAEAVTPGGSHFAREAVVAFGTRDDLPYSFHLWRRGRRALFPQQSEQP